MARKSSNRLTPRDEIKLKLEQEEAIKYDPESEKYNAIFWDAPRSTNTPILQKVRTYIWFFPDFLLKFINKTKPFSFLILYFGLTLLGWRAIVYASTNPESVLNPPIEQVLIEGAVGKVSSLNPLFITNNQIERDLQELIFNKIVTISSDESVKPELAESWAVSTDGKAYTIFLRHDVMWHDGESFDADDVIYTLKTLQGLAGEESYAESFENVEFEKIDQYSVLCRLPEASATFLQSLAINVVPEHILSSGTISDIRFTNFNSYPIGTGPFMLESNIESEIVLTKSEDYFMGNPKLDEIIYKMFATEDEAVLALRQFEVHTLTQIDYSTTQKLAQYDVYKIVQFPLYLRQKLIYFNLRNTEASTSYSNVRKAISSATNRNEIITAVLGNGKEATGPIPENSWAYAEDIERYQYNQDVANSLLEDAGWVYENTDDLYRSQNGSTLTVTLTLLDSPVNNTIVQILTQQWQAVGVKLLTNTQTFDRISEEIIPLRNFDALLFELENIPDPDKYNLWHSLKTEYPGLNLSGYSYDRVDILLEQSRTETDESIRKQNYETFQRYIMEDMPALYLYHPTFTFVVHEDVKGIELENISLPQDRYNNVIDWYIDK
jgi:peptide/nickel transport system substrate-binding protein